MWPALIGAAGSLIGGALNRNSAKDAAATNRKWALQDQAEQFVRLRAAAEKGGFNPLTVLGAAPNSGMPNQTQAAQSYMGTAIADSAAMLADGMSKQQLAMTAKAEDLARQKDILVKKLADATLRPKQPGIFQRGSNVSALPNGPDTYDANGKVAGLWIGGAFVPRPLGYSSGNDIQNELGDDNIAASAAVAPLAAAYTAALIPIAARQAKLVDVNGKSGGRGMSLDWRRRETSALNRGRAPLDLMFTGQGVVANMPRNVAVGF